MNFFEKRVPKKSVFCQKNTFFGDPFFKKIHSKIQGKKYFTKNSEKKFLLQNYFKHGLKPFWGSKKILSIFVDFLRGRHRWENSGFFLLWTLKIAGFFCSALFIYGILHPNTPKILENRWNWIDSYGVLRDWYGHVTPQNDILGYFWGV